MSWDLLIIETLKHLPKHSQSTVEPLTEELGPQCPTCRQQGRLLRVIGQLPPAGLPKLSVTGTAAGQALSIFGVKRGAEGARLGVTPQQDLGRRRQESWQRQV